MDNISILVIEDNIQDFLILKEYIRRCEGFEVQISHTLNIEETRKELIDNEFDLIFLDLFLPDALGRDSFTSLYSIVKDVPIIVLSGLSDKKTALEIVQSGAQDYIVKGEFDELLIEKAIIYSIERHKNQKRLEASEKQYRLTFQNAGTALAEYDGTQLFELVQKVKSEGKSLSEFENMDFDQSMEIRKMIKILNVNRENLTAFGCVNFEDYKNNRHLHHTKSSVKILYEIVKAIWNKERHVKSINTYKTSQGKKFILLSRITLYGFEDNNCFFIRSGTDITNLKEKEHQVARQRELAESLSNASLALLEKADSTTQIENALAIQAKTFGVDYLSIVEVRKHECEKRLSTSFKWSGSSRPSTVENDWIYKSPINEIGLTGQIKNLEKGEFILYDKKSKNDLEEVFSMTLEKAKVKSLLASPIFVNNRLRAALILSNFIDEKEWKPEEFIAVKSFSNAIGSFFVRINAEKELQKLNNELEERIDLRTEELTEAMAELESFSYSVSHDLRAPLRKVGGFSQILDKEYGATLPERARHLLKNIKDGAGEMSALIHDLLEFSRLGRQSISFNKISMTDLAQEVIHDATNMNPELNLNFRMNSLDDALGDRTLVRHVLNNLVWNAVKFSSKNENIEIALSSSKKDGFTEYAVKDNGIGIDMNYAHKVFNVFQRLHTKEEYEGTGVGLAIVKRIVKKHNGNVSVCGELNKGCTFTFTLPDAKNQEVIKNSKIQNKKRLELVK